MGRCLPVHVSQDTPASSHGPPKHPQKHCAVLDSLHQPVKLPALPLCQVPSLCVSRRACMSISRVECSTAPCMSLLLQTPT